MGTVEAKANPIKHEKVAALEEKLGKAQGIIFTDFSGLTSGEMNQLRRRFFEAAGAEYVVEKNTLMKLALTAKGLTGVEDSALAGPTGLALGYDDPVTPAKLIAEYSKEYLKNSGKKVERPVFKGALVDGTYYNVDQAIELAKLPPMQELRATIVGGIAAPPSQFVGVLAAVTRDFLYLLDALIEKKREAGEE